MKKLMIAALAAAALTLAATASAALVPSVYDPGNTGCVQSEKSHGWLHLAKNCATSTNAAAQAELTGVAGQPFTSASFTLRSASQCQGGSPRFNVYTAARTFFLGCNNVTPTIGKNGSATYTFTAATLAAAGQQVPTPTGTVTGAELILDVQGAADVKHVVFNGANQRLDNRHDNKGKHRGHHHHGHNGQDD
jgi:hypothetical protein